MNGTFLNETRVQNAAVDLPNGALIRFGYDTETFRYEQHFLSPPCSSMHVAPALLHVHHMCCLTYTSQI